MELRGANVVLTGGSRGLGPVIARALLTRGARLALSARSRQELEAVRDELAEAGTVLAIPADVTVAADRERLVATAASELGSIDVLVNNAGMQTILALTDQGEEDVRRQIELNVLATILLTHRVLPAMLERRRGHVVNLGSIAGMTIVPYETVYAATKHAVKGFSYGLRAELHGTGVGVSHVAPGLVRETGMFASQLAPVPPRSSGSATTAFRVAAAVVRAIERDLPEVVTMGALGRVADIGLAVSPRFTQLVYLRNATHRLIRRTAAANAAARDGADG